jgi:site-specific DNA recombinase
MEPKRKVAIYIRVSTTEQQLDGYGLEAQEKKLLDHVNNNPAFNLETKRGWIYSDTHTGSDLNRNDLVRLRDDVKAGKFDAVLVWKIDRLSRSLKHLLMIFEEFEQNKVSFISVQENIDFRGPIGKLIFQIFGAIAQFERELIKGRTQMGKIASAEAGNYTGTYIPYGYRPVQNKGKKGKRLEIIPDEQKHVAQMYDWYIFNEFGDGQIASKLNKLRVPRHSWEKNENGAWQQTAVSSREPWTVKMVTQILTNELYRGLFVAHNKDDMGNPLPEDKWTVVPIPPCVTELTFIQAQSSRSSRTSGGGGTDYLLSGKLKDYTLEKPKTFVGAKRYKGGFSYRRKQFKKDGSHTPVFEVPGQQLEEYVWGKVQEAMKDPEIFIRHYLSNEYRDPNKVQRIQTKLNELRALQIKEGLTIDRIEKSYDEGLYSQEKMASKVRERTEEMVKLDEQIQIAADELAFLGSIDLEIQKLKEASEQVKYRIDNLDRRGKKLLCNLFIDRVEMRRTKENGKWHVRADVHFRFNPDKLAAQLRRVELKDADLKPQKRSSDVDLKKDGGPGGI